MKRITPVLFTCFFVFMQVSQAQLSQVWKIDGGSDGRYPSTSDWYRGAAYNPATDHYLVISRALTPKIYVHNANTGALLDSLNVTGVTGGTFTLNEIEVTSAGVIYAANLVTAGTGYKIYRWANEAAVPTVAFDGTAGAARIGDVFDVAGAGTGTVIYASGNSSTSVIQRFTTTDGINFTLASPINITGQNAGAGIAQLAAGGNAYISRFQLDNSIKLVDTSGAVVDTIPATLTGRAHADLHYFETGGKKYLAIVPAGDGSTFAPARVLDVTAGPSGAIFVDSTVALGSNANGNASGDVDVKILSANSFVIFVLVGNNGIAAYRYGPPPPLSGTFTVGSGGAYPTLDSAFSALKTLGVSGPVTFSLTDTSYAISDQPQDNQPTIRLASRELLVDEFTPSTNSITDSPSEVVSISLTGPIPGASATNRVTVRPANNVKARIVGTGAATFNFLNVSYVTFDGISTTGPTQMSIENSATNGIAIGLVGNSDHNIVRNLTLKAPYASGIAVYMDTASLAAPDSNEILNNLMPITSRGVYLRGGNYGAYGNQIIGNTIGSDSIGALGIYNQQANGSIIANNHILNVKDAVAAGGNVAGIWVATKQLNMKVYNNVINGVRTQSGSTGAVFTAGIYYFGTAGDTSRSMWYNNMIYNVENLSSSASATLRAIYASTSINDVVAYNSVYLTGTDAGSVITGALYLGTPVQLTLRNNIAVNGRTPTGTGRALALYGLSTTATFTSNNNDLYVPTQSGSHVAAITTTNYTTLSAWQATGRDSQSVSVMPNFRSPDLHIDSTQATPINNGGTPIAGITTDIDGQTRSASTPDIGADEFTVPAPPPIGWTAQTSGVTSILRNVKTLGQTIGWIGGASGVVLRTTNGGTNWTSVGGGAIGTGNVHCITAVNADVAILGSSPSTTGYIFRTTNGGATWDTVFQQPGGGFIDAVHMFDATNGVALGDPVGGTWTIARTTNGGATWARIATEPPQVGTEAGWVSSFFALNTTTWWFGTSSNKVYKTTDAGVTWTSGATTGANSYAVWFNDALYGVAGFSNGTAERTTDGGATWSPVTLPGGTGTVYGVTGAGLDFWLPLGNKVFRSTNRGATWAVEYTSTIGTTLRHINFLRAGSTTSGWVVSSTGGIAGFYGNLTGVDDAENNSPQTFVLQQNYPNPFNPSTTIRYALPEASRVNVSIYNMLGQRVAELTNDVQSAGSYSVVWDGRNSSGMQVATGVYLYRMEATPANGGAQFTSMKKMLLLK